MEDPDAYTELMRLLSERERERARPRAVQLDAAAVLPVPTTGTSPKVPLKRFTPRHRQVVGLHLQGHTGAQIAELTGFSPAYVSYILTNPRTAEVLRGAYKQVDMELAALYPKAVAAIRRSLDSEDHKVALKGAELALRANGKLKDVGGDSGPATAEDVVRRLIEVRSDGPVELRIAEESRNG